MISAGPTVGVTNGEAADGVEGVDLAADPCVGAVFAFALLVAEVPALVVGAVVGCAAGGIAVGDVLLCAAATLGAQAASRQGKTNTALIRDLTFISILSFSGMILAFSLNIYAAGI